MNTPLIILVAEDSEDDIFLLKQAFKRAGVASDLHVVRDGLEAQAYLRGDGAFADRNEHPLPDVLLLDLNMPRMNGFELLEWMSQEQSCGRLITYVLTASSREADAERAYKLGANSYILKPTHLQELVDLVSTLHQWHRFVVVPRKRQPQATPA